MDADTVDYVKGETPMTDYQFQQYVKLRDENDALKAELDLLKSQNTKPGKTGMTDYQFKSMMKALYLLVKVKVENGASPAEILETISTMKDGQND